MFLCRKKLLKSGVDSLMKVDNRVLGWFVCGRLNGCLNSMLQLVPRRGVQLARSPTLRPLLIGALSGIGKTLVIHVMFTNGTKHWDMMCAIVWEELSMWKKYNLFGVTVTVCSA